MSAGLCGSVRGPLQDPSDRALRDPPSSPHTSCRPPAGQRPAQRSGLRAVAGRNFSTTVGRAREPIGRAGWSPFRQHLGGDRIPKHHRAIVRRRTQQRRPPPEPPTGPGLTTRQGHPVYDNKQSHDGERGPRFLENYHFLRRFHFDPSAFPAGGARPRRRRTRVFEAYGSLGTSLSPGSPAPNSFKAKGKRTRCSFALGPSSMAVTTPKHCATRAASPQVSTRGGNWDLVGNNCRSSSFSRCDEVPGRGARLQAGPGHQSPGPIASSISSACRPRPSTWRPGF